jgi:hypothetical protein
MTRPNFSGVYSLKSSENEDAFLKAQGISWVLRKAAKAVASKRVCIEHSGGIIKIKAGLVDLEYEIGGTPIPTSFMGFDFTDGCAWHSDGVSLCQTKLFKNGCTVTTVRSLSQDQRQLTYANCWVDKSGTNDVRSTQIFELIPDLPSTPQQAGGGEDSSGFFSQGKGNAEAPVANAPGGLKTLDDFVSGWVTPPDGYATPPEDFEQEQLSHEELLRQLTFSKEESLGSNFLTKESFESLAPYASEDTRDSPSAAASADGVGTQDDAGDEHTEGEVKLKWMWADAGVSSWLAQVCHSTKYTCHSPN